MLLRLQIAWIIRFSLFLFCIPFDKNNDIKKELNSVKLCIRRKINYEYHFKNMAYKRDVHLALSLFPLFLISLFCKNVTHHILYPSIPLATDAAIATAAIITCYSPPY